MNSYIQIPGLHYEWVHHGNEAPDYQRMPAKLIFLLADGKVVTELLVPSWYYNYRSDIDPLTPVVKYQERYWKVASVSRDPERKTGVQKMRYLVYLVETDYTNFLDLDKEPAIEVDICGYCETFPCAQLHGCLSHWE